MASSFNQNFDEHRWIIQIRRTLEEDIEEDADEPVCIFNVPRDLRASHPGSYEPQQVAIGPYHHWRPELHDMERYKLASAKRMQKQLHNLKFEQFVDEFMILEHRIRACYHKYLDFSGETLVWMMAMDASFVLEFLQVYTVREGRMIARVSSRKSAHYAILRDMVMLENQIPLFLLRKMLELQFSSSEASDRVLSSMLVGFCKEVSPFKTMEELPDVQYANCVHLLDFLYHVIVPELDGQSEITEIDDEDGEKANETEENCIKQLLPKIYKGLVNLVNIVIFSKMIKAALKLPWTFISNLPGISFVKTPIEYLFFTEYLAERKQETGGECTNQQPPLMEEITIPSVTELREAGFQFSPAKEGLLSISFDDKTSTIHLPTITLDVNANAALRNLVAYESCDSSGPLVLARYIELMNGIIDTAEDAKLLREKGVILNRLKSDAEVADLWNGMTKSVRLTKVPFLDKVIEDVNQCYRRRWKVKVLRVLKVCVFGSWPVFMFMVFVMLLFLVSLQTFSRIWRIRRGQ